MRRGRLESRRSQSSALFDGFDRFLLTKVGLIGEQRPSADIRGVLIFLHEKDDPGPPLGITDAESLCTAVYLNRFLPELLAQEPDNPFVVVLAPLVVERDEELQAQVPHI
ncbi:MAG TPA: hypothetical protein DIW77_10380 [Chromatiaceae bacterium]|nr:hypothetical protein [Chromatiaceae bacterium]